MRKDEFAVVLDILPEAENGLIMYVGSTKGKDFISLALRQGKLEMR